MASNKLAKTNTSHRLSQIKAAPDYFISSTKTFALSTVAAGPPGSAINTLPFLSTANTPRWVPDGLFFNPMALIRPRLGSQSSAYGRRCFSLKLVLALGESELRP